MPGTFAYVDRETCVCAARLDPARIKVEKAAGWGPIRFLECVACGSVVQSPQISPRSLAAWVSSPDYYAAAAGNAGGPYLDYLADEDQRQQEAEGRYQRDLRAILPTAANVLEVGCATGSMLTVLARHGHRVTGIDLSEGLVAAAKRLNGLSVVLGDFLDFHSPDVFDLIVMMGTVSNFPDPRAAFAHCRGLLRPSGRLYFNMPVAGSWAARLYGPRFWMYSPSCANFMSVKGCTAALEQAGLRLARVDTDRQMPTLAKLAGHLKLRPLYPFLEWAGVARLAFPIAWPVPGIAVVTAQKPG